MATKTRPGILPGWGNAPKVPASDAAAWIETIENLAGVNDTTLAHGVDMAESQISRIRSGRAGYVKAYTLTPLTRAAVLIHEARSTLTSEGAKRWLTTPSPYLNDVPPILCLRSDKELDRAKSALASIRYGFPA